MSLTKIIVNITNPRNASIEVMRPSDTGPVDGAIDPGAESKTALMGRFLPSFAFVSSGTAFWWRAKHIQFWQYGERILFLCGCRVSASLR